MLIVFQTAPISAPDEAVALEETIAEVAVWDFIFEGLGTVGIAASFLGVYAERAVGATFHAGIVERIDINGTATAMGR